MEFVRQVVNSDVLKSVLTVPPSFQDVQVEVIVRSVDDEQTNITVLSSFPNANAPTKPVKHSAFGRLSAFANPSLIPEEKGAWEKEVAEKYALR